MFGKTIARDSVDFRVEEGRILGLIGANGAGKTTALNAILGLTPYQGELKVLGRDPWRERDQLMRDVCFIADVAVLPRWLRVSQALAYVAGVHPRFDRAKAEALLAKTAIQHANKVRELSKGMVAQLRLALVRAIDAKLLVLDEPTLGLDLLYRKQFYDVLLNDYSDRSRTILVTTHQVEEIQHVLTDLVFINRGGIVLDCSMEEFELRYLEVTVHPERVAEARALRPISERRVFGRSVLLFDRVDGTLRGPAPARRDRTSHRPQSQGLPLQRAAVDHLNTFNNGVRCYTASFARGYNPASGAAIVIFAARVLLTILSIVQALATVLIDFNRTHATNPMWPGHARFHLVWQGLNQTLFAIVVALVLWSPGAYTGGRFYLAALLTAIPCLGFVLAQAARRAYSGTLSDPNGIPPFRFRVSGRNVEVDGNAAAVYCALAVLAVLVAVYHYASRSA